jgi:glycosyltransferase involved in cell wall biosynthesis
LYRHADIFCLPSVQEGFGIAFLEAMACALPVVATLASAIPEVVPDRRAGLLVRPSDQAALAHALIELLARPSLRAEYGAFGRAYVERFDWDRVAQIFLGQVAPLVGL